MSQARDKDSVEPRTNVRQAYERCLATRQQWRSVRAKTVDPEVRDEAHGDLHEAVMAWFETLVPYISERPGEVKQLWESAPLYPEEPKLVDALGCGNDDCGFVVETDRDDHELNPGSKCPYCQTPIEPGQVVDVDDDDNELYHWACGLKRLASWSSATTTETVSSGKWSTGEKTIERPKRLDPDILLRAARYLDLAAEECGLLESTDRALATGEL
jgi:hypothetical protein